MRISTIFILILKNFELLLRDVFNLKKRPYKILFELVNSCNSKCKTCYIWKNEEKFQYLKPTEIKNFLYGNGQDILWIALSGGEISLYPEFNDLLDVILNSCPKLRILTFTTNGLQPQRILNFAKAVQKTKRDVFVTVSLDGDKEVHDDLRGVEGGYERALETFGVLKENNIPVHFGLTLSNLNSVQMIKGMKLDLENIKAITFAHSGGIYEKSNSLDLDIVLRGLKKIIKFYKIRTPGQLVEWIYLKLAVQFFKQNKKTPIPCEAGSTNLHIRPNGNIHPCMFLPAIGNIAKDSLATVNNSLEIRTFSKRAKSKDCENCWMNCYAPHSMMRHPFKTLFNLVAR